MTSSITSLNAYHGEVKSTLKTREDDVFRAISALGEASNSELAEYLKWSINRVTPRVLELRDANKVELARIRECKVTGRQVKTWKLLKIKTTLF
jgi:hypothetical protein